MSMYPEWKLVPAEPTKEMARAAEHWAGQGFDWPKALYRAMLKVAPHPPAPTVAREGAQGECPVTGEERPYCYALETRGPHDDKSDVLLDVEYNGTDNFSGGRMGSFPLYRRPASAAVDAQDAARWRSFRNAITQEDIGWLDLVEGALQAMGCYMGSEAPPSNDMVDAAADAAIAAQREQA